MVNSVVVNDNKTTPQNRNKTMKNISETRVGKIVFSIPNKLNLQIEGLRIPAYVCISTLLMASVLLGLSIIDKV
jgi:hypothetical protein